MKRGAVLRFIILYLCFNYSYNYFLDYDSIRYMYASVKVGICDAILNIVEIDNIDQILLY